MQPIMVCPHVVLNSSSFATATGVLNVGLNVGRVPTQWWITQTMVVTAVFVPCTKEFCLNIVDMYLHIIGREVTQLPQQILSLRFGKNLQLGVWYNTK